MTKSKETAPTPAVTDKAVPPCPELLQTHLDAADPSSMTVVDGKVSQWNDKAEVEKLEVPMSVIDELWTISQEIAYHAEMDTVKGKRRGRWILPKAMELIKIFDGYRASRAHLETIRGGKCR